jgi:DNA-binding SARP family transcriptional activator
MLLAKRILHEDQFREDIHCMVMKAHAALGNRGAVKDQFEALKEVLHRELGVEPSKDTKRLYQELVNSV